MKEPSNQELNLKGKNRKQVLMAYREIALSFNKKLSNNKQVVIKPKH